MVNKNASAVQSVNEKGFLGRILVPMPTLLPVRGRPRCRRRRRGQRLGLPGNIQGRLRRNLMSLAVDHIFWASPNLTLNINAHPNPTFVFRLLPFGSLKDVLARYILSSTYLPGLI